MYFGSKSQRLLTLPYLLIPKAMWLILRKHRFCPKQTDDSRFLLTTFMTSKLHGSPQCLSMILLVLPLLCASHTLQPAALKFIFFLCKTHTLLLSSRIMHTSGTYMFWFMQLGNDQNQTVLWLLAAAAVMLLIASDSFFFFLSLTYIANTDVWMYKNIKLVHPSIAISCVQEHS